MNTDLLSKFRSKKRPHVKASKQLNLSGAEGEQIVKSETKLTLKNHSKTFEKLADM